MTKQDLVDALKEASKLGYLGGMSGKSGGGFSGGGDSGDSGSRKLWNTELGAATGAVTGLGSAALGMGSKLTEGGATIGDVTKTLSNGFAGLGASGSVLGKALETGAKGLDSLGQGLDQNIATWRKLSDTGLSFGNDIMAMKDQASNARLSIAEFGEVIQKNNATMVGFGVTSATSAKQLSKMSDEFFTSGLGEQLRGMGYTTKELNDVLAVSISGQKIKDLNDAGSRDKALKAASSLAFEMDAIAKITGKSKEAQLDEIRRTQADGQIIAATNLMVKNGGKETAEAMASVTANAAAGGDELKKLTLAYVTGAVLSQEQMQTFAMLGPMARESLDEAREATRRGADGDKERAAQATKMFVAQTALDMQADDRQQMIATGQFDTQRKITSETNKYAEAMKLAAKELGPNADAAAVATLGLKKLGEQVEKEQQAGGKKDPDPSGGAAITRFAVDIESRGRDLTQQINKNLIQPLAENDIGPYIKKLAKDLDLGSASMVKEKLADPVSKAYTLARSERIVGEQVRAQDIKDPKAQEEIIKLIASLRGSASTDAAKVIEKQAGGSENVNKFMEKVMANNGAGLAELNKQITATLAPHIAARNKTEQQNLQEGKEPPRSQVLIDAARRKDDLAAGRDVAPATNPAAAGAGKAIDAFGGLFRPGTPGYVKFDETQIPLNVKPKAVGGVIEKPEIILAGEAGPEAIFNKSQLQDYTSKVMGSAAGAMPKIEAPKIDLTSISKSISTSISSVTGGGSTTTKQVQTDDSKAAQQELLALEKAQVAERLKAVAQLKEEGVIKGKFASSSDYKNIPQLSALKEKQDSEKAVLSKRVDAGTSWETVREEAKAETTKMVSEQIAITKTSNSTLKDTYSQGAKLREAIALKDTESLSDMYKDDSKTKLAMAKLNNAVLFQEAELAKSVVGTSVKGMSEDMITAMIPKGATIEDYYVDMNGKLQSNAADAVAKMEKTAKDSANVVETYSTTISAHIADALPVKEVAAKQEEFQSQFTESQQKIIDDYKGYSEENRLFRAQAMQSGIKEDTETAQMIGARISKMKADIGDRQATKEEEAALENETLNKQMFEKQVESKKEMLDVMQNLGEYGAKRELELKKKSTVDQAAEEKQTAILQLKATGIDVPDLAMGPQPASAGMPDMSKTLTGLADEMTKMGKSSDMPDMFKSMSAGMPDMFKSISTSISSVTSPGSKAANKPPAGEKENAALEANSELARESRRTTPQDAPKIKAMSVSDMMSGGMTMGANGMPIMKSIDTARNSIPATKPADADAAREDAKFKRQAEEKKAEAAKMAEKKPDTKAATKESTLSDVVSQLNTLNKQMGQLIAVNEDGHKSTTKAAKSGASNIYAR